MKATSPLLSIQSLLQALLSKGKGKAIFVFLQQLFTSSLQGFGLLLIIPLLGLSGLLDQEGNTSGFAQSLKAYASKIGYEFSLLHILLIYAIGITILSALKRHHSIAAEKLQQNFVTSLGIQLITQLTHTSWLTLNKTKRSDLTQTLSEDLKQINIAVMFLFQFFGCATLLLTNLIVAAIVSPQLLAPSLIAIALLALAFRPLHKKAQTLGLDYRKSRESFFDQLATHLEGLKLIKAHGKEDAQIAQFTEISEKNRKRSLRFKKSSASTLWAFDTVAASGLALFIYVALQWIKMPPSTLILLIFVYARTLPQLTRIQQSWQGIQHALPSFNAYNQRLKQFTTTSHQHPVPNIFEHRSNPEPVVEGPPKKTSSPFLFTLNHQIQLKDISFAYPDNPQQAILQKANLTILAQHTTAIIGPSGTGKSTLSDILCGLIHADSGSLLIDEQELTPENTQTWQSQIAYIPQDNYLFHQSIRSNLLWANPQASDIDIWNALNSAQAANLVKSLPQQLDTIIGDRGSRLSGGERQRIALARALIRKPLLLILDEATNALDPQSEDQIIQALDSLHGSLTILTISHNLHHVSKADHVYDLSNGHSSQPK